MDEAVQRVLDMMLKDVEYWYEQTVEPIKLNILSQRFNRRLRQVGINSVAEAVERDPRLIMKMQRRGARLVMSRRLLERDFAGSEFQFWRSMNAVNVDI